MENYKTKSYTVFTICNYIFLFLIVAIMMFPYLNVIAKAFNDPADTMRGGGITLFPRKPTLDNFKLLFNDIILVRAGVNTIIRVVLGTAMSVAVQFMAAYALMQRQLVGKKVIVFYFIIPIFFSGGLIPQYLLYSSLGLLNNFLVYLLPGLFSFFNVIIMRTYIQTLPDSLNESAKLDGANHFKILVYVTVPLSLPILATITLWTAVYHWNDWTTTLYFVTKSKFYVMQYVLMQVIRESQRIQQMMQDAMMKGQKVQNNMPTTPEALRCAQVVITTLPIIMVYPFLQKYFIKGIMIGAIKE